MAQQHLTRPERETVVNMNDEDAYATIWTAQRPIIRKLKANPAAELIEEGWCGSSPYAYFRLPAEFITFRSQRRRRTDEQRAAASARMSAMHDAKRQVAL